MALLEPGAPGGVKPSARGVGEREEDCESESKRGEREIDPQTHSYIVLEPI